MRKKTSSIIFAILTAIIGALPHAPEIVPGGIFLTAAAVAVVVSVPPKCEAAIAPGIRAIVAIFQPPVCQASVMERLCSHVTSFLEDEADKAGADLKNCKKNCGWKKRKNDLITAAKKKAEDSCAKGEALDVNELSKGLDRNTKDRLKDLYERNSRMFDGKAKLPPDKDFEPLPSKQTTALTGKGGMVTDLKSAEPTTPKLNTASEFSLSGNKLSEDTSNPAATKQSSSLLAFAASAKTSADTAPVSSGKSPAAATTSAAGNQPPVKSQLASSDDGNYNTACLQALKLKCGCSWEGVCSSAALECFEKEKEICRIDDGGGCTAGKVTIDGPKDLFLSKPSTSSTRVVYKLVTTGKPPTNIQWSVSNAKVKFTMGTNQPTVQVIPTAESGSPGDVTISATVDNCPPPPPLALTVRRPKRLSHPPLKFKLENRVVLVRVGTDKEDDSFKKYEFPWTLLDQLGKPMPNILINEEVRKAPGSSKWAWWYLPWPFQSDTYTITGQATTNLKGEMADKYRIATSRVLGFRFNLKQRLIANGYEGFSYIEITLKSVTGTTPVTLE